MARSICASSSAVVDDPPNQDAMMGCVVCCRLLGGCCRWCLESLSTVTRSHSTETIYAVYGRPRAWSMAICEAMLQGLGCVGGNVEYGLHLGTTWVWSFRPGAQPANRHHRWYSGNKASTCDRLHHLHPPLQYRHPTVLPILLYIAHCSIHRCESDLVGRDGKAGISFTPAPSHREASPEPLRPQME